MACKNWHQLPPGPLKYPKAYEYEKGSFLLVPPGIILVYMLSSEQFEKHFWKVLWNSIIGGAEGIRTPYPFLAKEMLSLMSYSPTKAILYQYP